MTAPPATMIRAADPGREIIDMRDYRHARLSTCEIIDIVVSRIGGDKNGVELARQSIVASSLTSYPVAVSILPEPTSHGASLQRAG